MHKEDEWKEEEQVIEQIYNTSNIQQQCAMILYSSLSLC